MLYGVTCDLLLEEMQAMRQGGPNISQEADSQQYRPVQTSRDQYRPVETSRDQYRPVETSRDQYRPVETSTDQYRTVFRGLTPGNS
ncbi:hypothetical protein EYF80_018101 [Liparis tanakae]|uniref:Uncharacterized protein n=1 Tax=Liparis tanakae TaxID=230148 RepID=A0A4Z2I1Q2_9TELE|nr:hypothetical protein EYF80_018101 [Liparis tanakae]